MRKGELKIYGTNYWIYRTDPFDGFMWEVIPTQQALCQSIKEKKAVPYSFTFFEGRTFVIIEFEWWMQDEYKKRLEEFYDKQTE